jgi:hypothetical protein
MTLGQSSCHSLLQQEYTGLVEFEKFSQKERDKVMDFFKQKYKQQLAPFFFLKTHL